MSKIDDGGEPYVKICGLPVEDMMELLKGLMNDHSVKAIRIDPTEILIIKDGSGFVSSEGAGSKCFSWSPKDYR